MTLHHTCMQESKHCSMNRVHLDLTTRSVACLSSQSQHLYTLFTVHYPAHILQDVTTCHDKRQEHECFQVIYTSGQNLTLSHLMPHCGALSRHTVGCAGRLQAAPSNVGKRTTQPDWLFSHEPLDSLKLRERATRRS